MKQVKRSTRYNIQLYNLNLIKWILLTFSAQLPENNCSNSVEPFRNRLMVQLWDTLLVSYQLIQRNLEQEGKLPSFFQRCADDTLTITPNVAIASNFRDTLNNVSSYIKVMMVTEHKDKLPFLCIQLLNYHYHYRYHHRYHYCYLIFLIISSAAVRCF